MVRDQHLQDPMTGFHRSDKGTLVDVHRLRVLTTHQKKPTHDTLELGWKWNATALTSGVNVVVSFASLLLLLLPCTKTQEDQCAVKLAKVVNHTYQFWGSVCAIFPCGYTIGARRLWDSTHQIGGQQPFSSYSQGLLNTPLSQRVSSSLCF
jgi:hypothetical protein